MFFIVIGAWLASVVVSWMNHNRKLPLWIFGIGALVLAGQLTIGFGFLSVVAMAVLSVIIWIANKMDMA
jgi:hypothetical protein